MARFKVAKRVMLGPIPKTAVGKVVTGKVQKFALRERARLV